MNIITKLFALSFLVMSSWKVNNAMQFDDSTLQNECYQVISDNFEQYHSFSGLPGDLQLKILLSELKKLEENNDFYNDNDSDDDREYYLLEEKISYITNQVMILLKNTLLPEEEIAYFAQHLFNFMKKNSGYHLLDACNDMDIFNQQRISETLIRMACENQLFDYFTSFYDVLQYEEMDILTHEFSIEPPQFMAELKKDDKRMFWLSIYNNENLIEKVVPLYTLGHSIRTHDPKKIIAYHLKKNILAIPGYRQSRGSDFCTDMYLDIIWADNMYYTAQRLEGLSFRKYTKENQISKVLFTERFDKILLVTENGCCLRVELPYCISALINRELLLQEILFLLSTFDLHKSLENYTHSAAQFIEFLANHKILDELGSKNQNFANSLKLYIEELRYEMVASE